MTGKRSDSRDITGLRFGNLTVLRYAYSKHEGNPRSNTVGKRAVQFWHCRCDCGNETVVRKTKLTNGLTRSCGCLARTTTNRLKRIELRRRLRDAITQGDTDDDN